MSCPETVLCAALVAALATGCARGGSTAPSPVTWDSADVGTLARVFAMTDARRADPATIDAALASRESHVRAAGALAVGQVRGRERAAALRALLSDPDEAVAANAGYALGLLRDTASVGALAATLPSRRRSSVEAAWALGEIGEPARPAIVSALERADPRSTPIAAQLPEVTRELLLAASKLRPVPLDVVTRFLTVDSGDGGIQWAAAYAIARPRVAAGVRALLPLASARDPEVRAQVASAMRRTMTADSLAADALRVLRELARHPNAHVRINAIRSLATHGAAGDSLVVAALRDPVASVRVAAAQSLGAAGERDDAAWRAFLAADTSLVYRRSVLESAARAGVVRPEIAVAARDENWRARAAAANAAGAMTDPSRVAATLGELMHDGDARVREAAVTVLAAYPDSVSPPWRRDSLLAAVRDADAFVRAAALGGLQGRAQARDVPLAIASYRAAARDTANDARLAALQIVAAAWKADSAHFPDSLRSVIRALPVPADPLERAQVEGVSLMASWSGVPGRSRSLGWYEDLVLDYVLRTLGGIPYVAEIETDRGVIVLELFGADAPWTTANFVTLARAGFYRDTRFHRVVPNFVIQDGDPRGNGSGGPGYAIRDEINPRRYERGVLGMALSGPDTGGSQYFVTHSAQPHLDGRYTVFGRVIGGFGVLDTILQDDLIRDVRVR